MVDVNKLLVFLVVIFFVMMGLVALEQTSKRRSGEEKVREEVRKDYECDNRNLNSTDCLEIMNNSILAASHMRLMQSAPEALRNAVNKKIKCPSFRHGYLLNPHLTNGERSLSPYENVVDYDSNRIPRYISQAECLCKGCINPMTLRETKMLKSVKLTVKVMVFKRNINNVFVPEIIDITVGCTCIIEKRKQPQS